MIQVKICGITRFEDAVAAVESGAAMLGYNFFEGSPRYLSPQACRGIQDRLKAERMQVKTVGVFVNASAFEIQEILQTCSLDLAQLSGEEPLSLLALLGERAFKVLRPQSLLDAMNQAAALPARNESPHYLIDAYRPGRYGGTGKIGDWEIASELAKDMHILLAGGLNAGNVAEAVARVRPWGVDVASGVETSPGIKDPNKMRKFIQTAQDIEHQQVS